MKSSLVAFVIAVLYICVATAAESSFSCDLEKKNGHKVRYEWTKLLGGDDDRKLYIDAVLTLKNTTVPDPRSTKGKLISKFDLFVREHNDLAAWPHFTSLFFPWHRRYLLYFEDSLRSLGGKYSCITLPYWDWTKDSGKETRSPLLQNTPYSFGGNGNSAQQWCVTKGPFAGFSSINPDSNGCLKRQFDSTTHFVTPAALWSIIGTRNFYDAPINGKPQGFWQNFEAAPHANPHIFIGGDNGDMSVMYSPADPLFVLHHTMVDLVWNIWMDCHDHDKASDITSTIYTPFMTRNQTKVGVNLSLDAPMPYGNLNPTNTKITARMMHDISAWGYAYDRSVDLIKQSEFVPPVCKFDSFDRASNTKSRVVADDLSNMELANNIWRDLQQMKSLQTAEGRFKLLVMGECQVHKSITGPSSTNYTRWLRVMGGESVAAAFEPLC